MQSWLLNKHTQLKISSSTLFSQHDTTKTFSFRYITRKIPLKNWILVKCVAKGGKFSHRSQREKKAWKSFEARNANVYSYLYFRRLQTRKHRASSYARCSNQLNSPTFSESKVFVEIKNFLKILVGLKTSRVCLIEVTMKSRWNPQHKIKSLDCDKFIFMEIEMISSSSQIEKDKMRTKTLLKVEQNSNRDRKTRDILCLC